MKATSVARSILTAAILTTAVSGCSSSEKESGAESSGGVTGSGGATGSSGIIGAGGATGSGGAAMRSDLADARAIPVSYKPLDASRER